MRICVNAADEGGTKKGRGIVYWMKKMRLDEPRPPPNPRIICMETVRRRKMEFFSPYNNWLDIAPREKT
jgi:hypothetical protein